MKAKLNVEEEVDGAEKKMGKIQMEKKERKKIKQEKDRAKTTITQKIMEKSIKSRDHRWHHVNTHTS